MKLEEKIVRMEEISSLLENPNLNIDEGVKLYEEGVVLAKDCLAQLQEVKGKINIIKKDLEVYKEETME